MEREALGNAKKPIKAPLIATVIIFLFISIATSAESAPPADKPELLLLANSIDYQKNKDLMDFLAAHFEIIRSGAPDFSKYKSNRRILILGGPDAYDGVGDIAGEALLVEWRDYLRKGRGSRNIYLRRNVWGADQLVLVLAGNEREDTRRVAQEWKTPILQILSGSGNYEDIAPKDVRPLLGGQNVLLLDVRTPKEYQESHMEGAVNIPFDEVLRRYDEIDTGKRIIVYCHTGRRSALASQILANLGYEDVANLEGGLVEWQSKIGSYKIVSSPKPQSSSGAISIKSYGSARVGDAMIYYSYMGGGGCGTGSTHTLSFYRLVEDKEIPNGQVSYMEEPGGMPTDITEEVHSNSDVIDGYSVKVLSWSQPLLLEIKRGTAY